MEKEFTPYQEALELKELGFDETCFGYYVDGELRGINLGMEELGGVEPYYQRLGFHTLSNHDIDNPNKIVATAPTFSQVFRWFREKHHKCGWVTESYFKGKKLYQYHISRLETLNIISDIIEDYDEAELECLRKLIEIIKQQDNGK